MKALNNKDKAEHISTLKTGLRSLASKTIDAVLDNHELDVIIAPADSALPIYTAASGKIQSK